jgi:hypothetical protein
MTNLIIYNGENSQDIVLTGLLDNTGNPVSAATITATLSRAGITLAGSSMTFSADETPGSYTGQLNGFDAPPGIADLLLTGSNSGVTFNFKIFVNIAIRSL